MSVPYTPPPTFKEAVGGVKGAVAWFFLWGLLAPVIFFIVAVVWLGAAP